MSKLKTLILRKRIDEKKKALEELRAKAEDFAKREADLTEAFAEVNEETSAEDKAAIEEDMNAYDADKAKYDEDVKNLQDEIASAESELNELEAKQDDKPAETENRAKEEKAEKRGSQINMTVRFRNMCVEERSAFVARDSVKEFLGNVRSVMQKRAVTGTELLIPTEVLPLVYTEIREGSKLLKHVNVQKIGGKARQNIIGDAPEGVWTEMCANLNELTLNFTNVEVDGYKVGGYVPVCNAVLEDSDEDLAAKVFEAIGNGIGYALDKAIVYGTGTKMPTGFAKTAVKGTTKASDGVIKSLIKAFGAVKHARGEKFWVMNNQTYMNLVAETFNVNNGVATVSTDGGLYVLGGAVEVLDFIPNDEILGGFGQNYLLGERAGITLAESKEVQFIEDNTVFKGTARYDGKPVFVDAFLAFSTTSTAPTAAIDTAHTFAGQD